MPHSPRYRSLYVGYIRIVRHDDHACVIINCAPSSAKKKPLLIYCWGLPWLVIAKLRKMCIGVVGVSRCVFCTHTLDGHTIATSSTGLSISRQKCRTNRQEAIISLFDASTYLECNWCGWSSDYNYNQCPMNSSLWDDHSINIRICIHFTTRSDKNVAFRCAHLTHLDVDAVHSKFTCAARTSKHAVTG